ncbi:MAG: galactose oxidase [Chloroflexi bacterium]|nr:galactose oxidase [Chloroflexota bacterium]
MRRFSVARASAGLGLAVILTLGAAELSGSGPFAASAQSVRDTLYLPIVRRAVVSAGPVASPTVAPTPVPSRALSWSTRSRLPSARESVGAATGPDGRIYVFGGYAASSERLTATEIYDPATDTWTPGQSMPTVRQAFAVAIAPNGKIYVAGGIRDNQIVGTFEEYDPATDTWQTRASLATPRSALALAEANGKLYALGGADRRERPLATLEEYDPATDTWRARASLPVPAAGPRVAHAAVGLDGKIYVLGGFNPNSGIGILSGVEEYDPATNTWSPRQRMPTARQNLGVVAGPNGRIYALGGFNDAEGGILRVVEEYDRLSNTWRRQTSMPTARLGLAVAFSGGRMYAVGGGSHRGPLSVVEEATP